MRQPPKKAPRADVVDSFFRSGGTPFWPDGALSLTDGLAGRSRLPVVHYRLQPQHRALGVEHHHEALRHVMCTSGKQGQEASALPHGQPGRLTSCT